MKKPPGGGDAPNHGAGPDGVVASAAGRGCAVADAAGVSVKTENRRFGIRWATETLLGRPGHDESLAPAEVEALFWVALDWGTYRTLTEHAGLTPDGFEQWLAGYYRRVFVRPRGA